MRDKLGISVHDSLEWVVEKGRVVVHPVHSDFLRYRGTVKMGPGDNDDDIQAAREHQMEKYR